MKLLDYPLHIAPRAVYDRAVRLGLAKPVSPLALTFSVTAACQSCCKTCRIGERHQADPGIAARDLSLEEIERVFASCGPVYFFNISGGEPFLRPDLADIIRLACVHMKPRLIHISTNALAPARIERTTREILAAMDRFAGPGVPISIKPSIDGLGERHDAIRGVEGNFRSLERTLDALLAIRAEHPRLHVDLGTVISRFNIDHLDEVEDWVHARGIESYRHEIAEQRAEFHNLDDSIAPSVDEYAALVLRFKRKIIDNLAGKAWLTRTTEAVRLVYYDVTVQILREQRQITPCFAGSSSVHLNHDGQLWPCCVLGGQQALGQVREAGYDLMAVLRSERADVVRQYIAAKRCACPMANMWLTNILLTPRHMAKVVATMLRAGLAG